MTHTNEAAWEMRTSLRATLPSIEDFLAHFRQRSQAAWGRRSSFPAELLLREALTNAVVHGCHTDPCKQVRCSLRFKNRRLLVAVEDDGDGFDWRAAWEKQADFSDCSGRGVELLRMYSNHVRYNDKGNAIAIVKRFE